MLFLKNKNTEKIDELKHKLLLAEAESSFKNSQFDQVLMKKYFEYTNLDQSVTTKFSAIQKLGISACYAEPWSIQKEIDFIELYVDLWSVLDHENSVCKLKIQLEDTKALIQPLSLIPLIQNSFYYGYNKIIEFPIKINLSIIAGRLSLTVSNRVNHHLNNQDDTKIMGLYKSRLLLMYPNHQLITNSNTILFRTQLTIDLREGKKNKGLSN